MSNNPDSYSVDGRAVPTRKDIFVEVDWMEGHEMKDPAKWRVGTRFLNNPTGEEIWLHIDDGLMGGGEQIGHHDRITFDDEDPNHPNYPDYMGYYKDKNYFDNERKDIFHYCLFVHHVWYNDNGDWIDSIDGVAYPDDTRFVVAEVNMDPKIEDQAQTFMHELGHNIGLDDDDYQGIDSETINYEDYPSVMNYNWGDNLEGYDKIDYSHGTGFDDWDHIMDGDLTE